MPGVDAGVAVIHELETRYRWAKDIKTVYESLTDRVRIVAKAKGLVGKSLDRLSNSMTALETLGHKPTVVR